MPCLERVAGTQARMTGLQAQAASTITWKHDNFGGFCPGFLCLPFKHMPSWGFGGAGIAACWGADLRRSVLGWGGLFSKALSPPGCHGCPTREMFGAQLTAAEQAPGRLHGLGLIK